MIRHLLCLLLLCGVVEGKGPKIVLTAMSVGLWLLASCASLMVRSYSSSHSLSRSAFFWL